MPRSSHSRLLALVAVLGTGVLVLGTLLFAVDASPERTSSPGVSWATPVEVASGDAYRGPWRMNESDWNFVDDPTVALADDGTAGVVWTNHVEQDLFFRAYGPEGTARQATPVNVSQTPDTFSWLPRMVFPEDDAGTVYVLWQEIIFSGGTHGGEILFARSQDGGQTFSDPHNLSTSEAGDGKGRLTEKLWHNGSLDLAVGPEGAIYAAWTEYEGRLWVRRSTDGGAHFSDPRHVTGSNTEPARGPALAVGPGGAVHLAWTVGEDPSANIHYTRSREAWDAFAPPRTVATSDGHADAPKLAVDSTGTVHMTYAESPTGPLRQYRIQYTRAPDESSSFRTPTVVSSRQPDTYESAHFPYMRAGPSGTLHVLWELYRDSRGRPRALGYTHLRDRDSTFAPASVVPGSADSENGFNGSQQGLLMEKLAVNDAGELAVVNSTFKRGEASHIWLYRGQASGR